MSGLSDRLLSIITGGRGTPAPGGSFREQADALRARAGSLNAAARLAGVDRRTYQRWYERWNAGKEPRPRPGTLARLAEGQRRAQLDPARPGEGAVSLRVVDRGKGRNPGGRERVLTNTNLRLRPGTMDRVRDTWVRTGDPEAAAAAFLAGITVPFYKRWLTPPSSDRNTTVGSAGPAASAGGDIDGGGGGGGSAAGSGGPTQGDDEDESEDEDEFQDLDAWDEFYDEVYEDYPEMDEDYGGDVT